MDNQRPVAKGYLLHGIQINFKHAKVLQV